MRFRRLKPVDGKMVQIGARIPKKNAEFIAQLKIEGATTPSEKVKESITSRVGRIISGGFNALVDAVEDAAPEIVMEESIREIDGAIDEVRAELGRIIANKHLASRRLVDESRKHDELTEKMELAVKESRDDLAEAAIASQLDIEAQIPVLEARIADCSGQEKELESYITALQAKKREMKDELQQFRGSRQEAANPSTSTPGGAASGSAGTLESRVSKATSAFDRVQERATGLSASAAPSRGDTAKLAELDELARSNRIQERLAAIKNRAKSE